MDSQTQAMKGELASRLSKRDATKLSLLDMAQQQYPVLKKYPTQYKENFGGGQGYLEHYSSDETGTEDHPRPFPLGTPGVEIYREDTKPSDVAADIVSHRLVNEDPTVSAAYQQFSSGLTPSQKSTLQEQYKWAQQNEGEARPYDEWANVTGVPGAFRGYMFQQWPKEFNDKFYTPEQRASFDKLNSYLTTDAP